MRLIWKMECFEKKRSGNIELAQTFSHTQPASQGNAASIGHVHA